MRVCVYVCVCVCMRVCVCVCVHMSMCRFADVAYELKRKQKFLMNCSRVVPLS